ncbi:saccharopine dehydrogenase family protein [Agromyces marinus]|uniref:Saccharopine dehydrogenase n=1 Tax=Agromyces marinus TaxID=1389020 RepID=A0ABM8H3I9_9MICO|nr:hypothetical protein [Agromyces marinus]UIP59587.1 hypothetical protein DSM26151_24980 [Agromyces marinus]BDZ55352.1 hypothetical protein GCM10025870_24250 [Agromyces marinus]
MLGARGAVGRSTADAFRSAGIQVTEASRASNDPDARIDLATDTGWGDLARAAAAHEVVVNATGIEDPRFADAVGPTAFVDISPSGAYLEQLRAAADARSRIVLGAGLAPGLSTILVDGLERRAGDEIDVAVLLGSGEEHGAAAVDWTIGLLGTDVHAPVEGARVPNLRERRSFAEPDGGRRTYLRADFPDHVLIGGDRGIRIRSYFAVTGRASTAALALAARLGRAGAGIVRHAPPTGSSRWRVTAVNRRTAASATASGDGQSLATGRLAALAATRIADAPPGTVTSMAGLATPEEARTAVGA